MGFTIKKPSGEAPSVWYAPDCAPLFSREDGTRAPVNNRSLDPEEQITVELFPLTAAQAQARREKLINRHAKNLGGAITDQRDRTLSEKIGAVRNVPGVENGRALVKAISGCDDPGLDAMLEDIDKALGDMSVLEEGRRPS